MDSIILYVEDDHDDVDIFSELLHTVDPSIRYLHAKNGEVALELLRELVIQPKFIFFDVNMPIMDGREFLRQVRADPGLRNIAMIAYTTSRSESDKIAFQNLGVTEYLVKPMNYLDAVEDIRRILKQHQ